MAGKTLGSKPRKRNLRPSKTITIKGTQFEIIDSSTPADQIKAGRPRLAADMKSRKIKRTLHVKKPRGAKMFVAHEFESGQFAIIDTGRAFRA